MSVKLICFAAGCNCKRNHVGELMDCDFFVSEDFREHGFRVLNDSLFCENKNWCLMTPFKAMVVKRV